MSLTATIYTFEIDLVDHDRQVYDTLFVRAARHPSESEEYLWTRVLAFAAEHTEGIEFSPGGLSDPDQPAIVVRDLTGRMTAWIEIGLPDAERMHRAMKAAPRVAVYAHRDPTQLLRRLEGERIHRAEALAFYAVDRDLLARLQPQLSRRVNFTFTISEGEWVVSIGGDNLDGRLQRLAIT